MRQSEIRKAVWASVFALGLSTAGFASPAAAQTAGDSAANTALVTQPVENNDDDGMDLGWLGLLGLAGLLGLRRRDNHVHHTDRVDHTTHTTRP